MASNPHSGPEYIRSFAKAVRDGASLNVWNKYSQHILDDLGKIEDSNIKSDANRQFVRISGFDAILHEKDSRNLIADEIDKFADFVSNIK